MITRNASKMAIGRCKGMGGLSLSEKWIETEDRVLNNLQDSSFKINKELRSPTYYLDTRPGGCDSFDGISTKCIIYFIHTDKIP